MNYYNNVSELYDLTYENRKQDAEFYKKYLTENIDNAGSKKVLEVGAGTGRILLPIAYELNEVSFVALDLIEDELNVLKEKAFRQNIANVVTECGDFISYKSEAIFDVVTAPFRVMQHCLSCDELEKFSSQAFDLLKENGKFVFDLFNPSIPMLSQIGNIFEGQYKKNNNVISRTVEVNERDHFQQTQKVEEYFDVVYSDGKKDNFEWIYETRYFFKDEVKLVLEKCGFEVENIYGDFNENNFGKATYPGELVFVCNKPKIS